MLQTAGELKNCCSAEHIYVAGSWKERVRVRTSGGRSFIKTFLKFILKFIIGNIINYIISYVWIGKMGNSIVNVIVKPKA